MTDMDAVYKLLNKELCQKNQELKMLLNREQRVTYDLQEELKRERERSAAMHNHIRQLCTLTTTFTGGFSHVFNDMRSQGILQIDQTDRNHVSTVHRRSTSSRRSVILENFDEEPKSTSNISGLNHSNENSSTSDTSSKSDSSIKSRKSNPDISLEHALVVPTQIQQINHSVTIQEEDNLQEESMELDDNLDDIEDQVNPSQDSSQDLSTMIEESSQTIEESSHIVQEELSRSIEEPEEMDLQEQELREPIVDDQLLYTITEEDSSMLNNISNNKENVPVNKVESRVSLRKSKLTKENLRRATIEHPMEVIETGDEDELSFESHEGHIMGNETINKNHSILQKAASTPMVINKALNAIKASPKTPSLSFSLTLEKIKISPNTMAAYNTENLKFESSDSESFAEPEHSPVVKKEVKAKAKGAKKQKPVERRSTGRPKRKAKPSIGSLIEKSCNKKMRR